MSGDTCSGLTKRARNCAKDGDDYRYPLLNSFRVNLLCTHDVNVLWCKDTHFFEFLYFFLCMVRMFHVEHHRNGLNFSTLQ